MRRALVSLVLLALVGCGTGKPAAAETHSTVGVVVEVKPDMLVIQHEDFPGFMKAMTMPFELADTSVAQAIKRGDKVAFTLTKVGQDYPITEIHKLP